ncbi:hypothetical protein DMH15_32525 [Streptomyces sp. WAC 06725]|uniref:ANTAR domain-containing protein n=1 Tax=Streptomyces sp. WAC 06725 TaxID=2203209 RepID=UPI000F73B3F5|nr:ANTAR domain-containing protein [Streptomyces sp. WAC 06725]RSO23005.1 hypothetical protein DMH15_32525 [Streptomyces sp. WAC 06725]
MRPPRDEQDRRVRAGPSCVSGSAVGSGDAEQVALLRQEVEQLRQALDSRPVIDMARGVLMGHLGCSPLEAWKILKEVSQHSNVRLRVMAESVTAAVTEEKPLPGTLRNHLFPVLERWRGEGT